MLNLSIVFLVSILATGPSAAAALSIPSLELKPFGDLGTLVSRYSPWKSFNAEDPVLTAILADQQTLKPQESCASWRLALKGDVPGAGSSVPKAQEIGARVRAEWFPLEDQAKSAAEDCQRQPCLIKLSAAEVAKLQARPRAERPEAWVGLVSDRIARLEAGGPREAYEYPGALIDPWDKISRHGVALGIPPAGGRVWSARVLDFSRGRLRKVRQVLEHQVSEWGDPTGTTALQGTAVWIRDGYNAHYFDSWGELIRLECDPVARRVRWLHTVVVELDTLKETDWIARISRPKMRKSFQDQAWKYMEDAYARISAKSRPEMPSK